MIVERQIVAMRGRNPDNPTSRESGLPTEQRLEVNNQGISNCITTVEKDNLVLSIDEPNMSCKHDLVGTLTTDGSSPKHNNRIAELHEIDNPLKDMDDVGWHFAQNVYSEDSKCIRSIKSSSGSGNIPKVIKIKQATKEGSIPCEIGGVFDGSFPNSKTRRGRVQDKGNVCPTITAQNQELYRIEICECNEPGAIILYVPETDSHYMVRIRKLTPRECLRLMAVEENNIDKILEVNSNTQAYKQAGNSIVVDCMTAMFSQLGIPGVKKWNDIHKGD